MTTEPLPDGWQQFQRKPAPVTGIQWTGQNTALVEAGIPGRFRLSAERGKDAEVYDKLHHSWIGLRCGAFVMLGTEGETWPVEEAVFPKLYERPTETPKAVVVACGLAPGGNETQCLHWYRSADDARHDIWEVLTVTKRGLSVPAASDLAGAEDWARDAARAAVALKAGRHAEAAGYATHRLGQEGEPYLVEVPRSVP